VTLAKFDTTLTSHLGFPDPNYFICLLFTLSVPSEEKVVFPHNDELSVLSILELVYYSKQLNKYLSSNIIQSKNKDINEPIIHLKYISRPID
jgi:hypothetical protein